VRLVQNVPILHLSLWKVSHSAATCSLVMTSTLLQHRFLHKVKQTWQVSGMLHCVLHSSEAACLGRRESAAPTCIKRDALGTDIQPLCDPIVAVNLHLHEEGHREGRGWECKEKDSRHHHCVTVITTTIV